MIVADETITCCDVECGISFAVPSWWAKGKRETHSWFYCPNGHRQHFTAESEADKLRRENARLLQREAMLEDEKREEAARAAKAEKKIKTMERRASAGMCPCCNRTFRNMERHMKTKHPDIFLLKRNQA